MNNTLQENLLVAAFACHTELSQTAEELSESENELSQYWIMEGRGVLESSLFCDLLSLTGSNVSILCPVTVATLQDGLVYPPADYSEADGTHTTDWLKISNILLHILKV